MIMEGTIEMAMEEIRKVGMIIVMTRTAATKIMKKPR